MTHLCPEPSCSKQVPFGRLACVEHWFMVPRPLRDSLMRAWNGGSPGPHYMQAREDCVKFLEHRAKRP